MSIGSSNVVDQYLGTRARRRHWLPRPIIAQSWKGNVSPRIDPDIPRRWRACRIELDLGCVRDLHARHTWPVADGEVVSASQKDSIVFPGATTTEKHTRYWVEYEVRFAVPADQCKTGTVSVDEQGSMPCRGIVRTRSTSSPYAVYDLLSHGYQRNSHVQILHDPNGPDVKIAGESAWLVYSWDKIFLILGWLAFFLTLHTIVQRRLEYLETLREDYDAFPSRSSPQPGPDDLTDLNLP